VLTVSLPNHTIRPMEKVRARRSLLIGLPGMFVPAEADVKYQYLGVRTHKDNLQSAVFEVTGNLHPRRGDDVKIAGRVSGTVELVASTGEVLSGNTTMTVDLELAAAASVRLFGSIVTDYRRSTPPPQANAGDGKSPAEQKPAEGAKPDVEKAADPAPAGKSD